ncbi:hypothetical protein M436DRAFT_63677 [Aureobasidium namibiae CBS 147.97]|uniref:Uncharacterized protein n=1 Tax=Aureobasidium namibiae CBS 147.97 TaxID=1043004 RepID=A0A074WUF5_9PEZI|nr:uncharacterized protein M436DRAFT_63677 [Aureobasidium namibiae CBS 147.97]KEQ73367.1 hypothetical protein M436DRAFT_63677 [Aureobasidium namibiae CBS 147.97]
MVLASAIRCPPEVCLQLDSEAIDIMFSLSIISALVLVSIQQALAQSCSGFNVTTDYSDSTYTSISRSFIISKGITCPSSQNCSLDTGGWVTDGRTLNISDQASAKSIYETISKVVDLDFKEPQTYEVTTIQDAFKIGNSTSAYVVFTPYTICATGILSDCEGNDLEGQTVEACTLDNAENGDRLNGLTNSVVTDREIAGSLTCNPSNTTQAKNGNYTGSCTGAEDATGAGSTLGGVSLALLATSLLVAFVGF